MLELYNNIKKRRLDLGLTQSDLAKKLGYSDKTMISKIENGMVDMPQSKIIKIAEVLHTTPGYLMGWSVAAEKDNNSGIVSNNIGSDDNSSYSDSSTTTNNYYNGCGHCDEVAEEQASYNLSQNKDTFFAIMDHIRTMNDTQLEEVLRYTEFILSKK